MHDDLESVEVKWHTQGCLTAHCLDVQDVHCVIKASAVNPVIPSLTTTTFSTALPFGPFQQTACTESRDIPLALEEPKLPAGHYSSANPTRCPQASPRPVRQVNARRQLKYSELEQLDSDPEPESPVCNANNEQAGHTHRAWIQ